MQTASSYERPAYRGYVLAMLTVGCALNFLDRQLVVILQEPIRHEFGLSDTQLGLLSGFGFAGIYVVCGVLVALWSERRARRGVVALAIGSWSLMTAVFGLTQGYGQMLLARMGVAIGESGNGPASHSMISDIYPPERRGFALAIYSSGVNFGILFGFLLGGWINEFFGWRAAFLALGLPGIAIAVLVRFTVAEPVRGRHDPVVATVRVAPRLVPALGVLWRLRSFRWIALASAAQAFGLYGTGAWFPSYLIRSFGLGTGEAGTWLALIAGGVGALGTLTGGWLADRLAQRDPCWYLWLPLACGFIGLPFALAMFLASEVELALALNVVPVFVHFVYLAPVLAITHRLVEPQMRATTSAVLFFVLNLVGMGGGPLFVGMLSDALAADFGDEAMRIALITTVLLATACGSIAYLRAARALPADLRAAS